jgi:division protein CdvB (Snf7/Vps24/ESCRT-III family)
LPREFAEKWRPQQLKATLHTRIKEVIHIPRDSVKQRIYLATRRMELQIQRLERSSDSLSKRDKSLFTGIVNAYSKHDMVRAGVLASELAEMRAIEKVIMHARLALEQIVLRLRTVVDFGDTVSMLAPTVSVLHGLKNGMSGILPSAEREFGEIGDLLQGIVIDSSQGTEFHINLEEANEDSQKILKEAATVAEKKISRELPEIP